MCRYGCYPQYALQHKLVYSCAFIYTVIKYQTLLLLAIARCIHVTLQVDVVEAEYTVLCSAIADARDFNAAQSAHARFLAKLQQGTHLASHHVSAALAQPLTTSLKLCKLLRERRSVMNVQLLEVTRLQGEFERQLCYLFKLLTQVCMQICKRIHSVQTVPALV
jgi:hypothetical protein